MTKRKIYVVIPVILQLIMYSQCSTQDDGMIMTVKGKIMASEMGVSLTHEHILVDFIGADSITENRWDKQKVSEKALPFLLEIKKLGCQTIVECTPDFLGRDPLLLKSLSDASGLNLITNTGYYGAAGDKYVPKHAYSESAETLALRWINEWKIGIGSTGVKPGFIKIGVDSGPLSEIDKKLVKAAAITHLQTGLTIASHTGPAVPAFEELQILQEVGVAPEAFIWVHAQSEKDLSLHIKAAKMGAWIGLDGISDSNTEEYVSMIKNLKDNGFLGKVLLSHDAGWYNPGEENGGEYRGYKALFENLVPSLRGAGFSEKEINELLVTNPAKAFTIRVRKV
jgi:phosphotriesterase-related protein